MGAPQRLRVAAGARRRALGAPDATAARPGAPRYPAASYTPGTPTRTTPRARRPPFLHLLAKQASAESKCRGFRTRTTPCSVFIAAVTSKCSRDAREEAGGPSCRTEC